MIWGKTWIGHLQWMAWDLFSVYHAHIQMDCFYNCQYIDWNEDIRLRAMPRFCEGVILTCLGIYEDYELGNPAWHQLEGHDPSSGIDLLTEKKSALKEVVYTQPDSVTQ